MSVDADLYVTVEIDLVATPPAPAFPRVRAYVDGVKVTWRWRDRDNGYWNRIGWFCSACSSPDCWHVEEVEDVLSPAVITRLRQAENARGGRR